MKIPISAKKVFQGTIFSVWQWEQKMYDGKTATFEAIKRPDTIMIIPTIGEKILLSLEEQPTRPKSYTFFGGRQEEGEDPISVAKRELLEETGFRSDDWELLKTLHSEGKVMWDTYLFVARDCRKTAEPMLDSGEKIEIKEVDFDELVRIVCSESFWGQNISLEFLRMRLDHKKILEFKNKIFGF